MRERKNRKKNAKHLGVSVLVPIEGAAAAAPTRAPGTAVGPLSRTTLRARLALLSPTHQATGAGQR